MSILCRWLERYFDELSPKVFYRQIFPEGELDTFGSFTPGKYVGIVVGVTQEKREDGRPKIRRYTVTDDLDVIDKVCETDNFCIMSPISYAGKSRTADNARFLYAFAVDLDCVRIEGDSPVGLRSLWEAQIEKVGRIPKPTMIVSSGSGLHLYYVLSEPVALFKDTSKVLQNLKRDLTTLIWHDAIVDIKSAKDIQYEGIYQGFRMPGTITKSGERARAFLTGERISIEDLESYTEGFRELREKDEQRFVKKKDVTLKVAREKYLDWYERRIVRGEPRGVWHISCNVYDWWKGQILKGAVVGHRYYCMMILAIYARKCSMYDPKHNPNPVTREELERDAYELMDYMESLTISEDNHFTTGDVLDALEAFEDKWITYPRNSIEYKSGIKIIPNKRNGRQQIQHMEIMRAIQGVINPDWRQGNGRPNAEADIRVYLLEHPTASKAAVIRGTGKDKKTVYKYYDVIKRDIIGISSVTDDEV